ncbi:hypothetical protein [Clavibacter tessellarius]|uniref:hypothetical protein n=1 Tax=Clavibacter tessellarius TaxID=31965 RepID=UPI00324813C7
MQHTDGAVIHGVAVVRVRQRRLAHGGHDEDGLCLLVDAELRGRVQKRRGHADLIA